MQRTTTASSRCCRLHSRAEQSNPRRGASLRPSISDQILSGGMENKQPSAPLPRASREPGDRWGIVTTPYPTNPIPPHPGMPMVLERGYKTESYAATIKARKETIPIPHVCCISDGNGKWNIGSPTHSETLTYHKTVKKKILRLSR